MDRWDDLSTGPLPPPRGASPPERPGRFGPTTFKMDFFVLYFKISSDRHLMVTKTIVFWIRVTKKRFVENPVENVTCNVGGGKILHKCID